MKKSIVDKKERLMNETIYNVNTLFNRDNKNWSMI